MPMREACSKVSTRIAHACANVSALALAIALAFVPLLVSAKLGMEHQADIVDVIFDGNRSEEVTRLADYISKGIDMGSGLSASVDLADEGSSFLRSLADELGDLKGLGDHRAIGHWGFNSGIPKDFLDTVERLHPGKVARVKDLWREFVLTRTVAVKQVFNLSGPNADRVAHAIAAMMNDVHCLGDHTTTFVKSLKTQEYYVDDLLKSMNQLLHNNNNVTKALKQEVMGILKTGASQDTAKAILSALRKSSPEFSRRLDAVFRQCGYDGVLRGIDYAGLKGITSQAARTARELSNAERAFARGSASAAKAIPAGGARIREVVKAGKRIKMMDVPVVAENGELHLASEYFAKNAQGMSVLDRMASNTARVSAKTTMVQGCKKIGEWLASPAGQGTTAGVLTFAISEGEAIVAFRAGEIESDEFVRKTTVNAGVAVAEGAAVYLISTAMAGAPVIVTIGTLVVAGIVIEKAGEYIAYCIEREVGSFPGITIDDLFFEVDDSVRNKRTVLDDYELMRNGYDISAPIPYSHLK